MVQFRSTIKGLVDRLGFFDSVSAHYLGFFRLFAFGLIAAEIIQYSNRGYPEAYLIASRVRFPYELIPINVAFTQGSLNMLLGIVILSAVLCSIGLYFRVFRWVFLLSFGFYFFQDKMLWNNHWYLFLLLGISSLFFDMSTAYSVSRVLKPVNKFETVPRLVYQALALQVGSAYLFGGIAKLNADWLFHFEPVHMFLQQRSNYFILGSIFSSNAAPMIFAIGGALYDLCIVFVLLNRRTFKFGIAATVVFNITNALIFDIGMFPFFMLASNLLFIGATTVKHSLTSNEPPSILTNRTHGALFSVFLLFQLIFPLRQFLYQGNPSWIGRAERFSWRMMIQTKSMDVFEFYLVDKTTGKSTPIDLRTFMYPPQVIGCIAFPEMIGQLALQLKEYFEESGRKNFEVRAIIKVGLNGRPAQLLVDPNMDLSAHSSATNSFIPPDYIVSLAEY
jgi:hypothetical protein